MQQTATIQVRSARHGNDSRKSKSRYYIVDVTIDGKRDERWEIRVSDHWYINGDAYQRGGAGKYTRAYMENKTDAIEFAPDWWVECSDGHIAFTMPKKPTVAQVLKVLQSEAYAAAWAKQYERGI
jgi:hypothetical protein